MLKISKRGCCCQIVIITYRAPLQLIITKSSSSLHPSQSNKNKNCITIYKERKDHLDSGCPCIVEYILAGKYRQQGAILCKFNVAVTTITETQTGQSKTVANVAGGIAV